jgi:hypothetical protein
MRICHIDDRQAFSGLRTARKQNPDPNELLREVRLPLLTSAN